MVIANITTAITKLTNRSKRRIGVIPVDLTQRITSFTTSKQPKTQELTLLTYRLHKTSRVTNMYTTTSRNSATDS